MPELQEIDRLIAGTPPAEAPEAAGPSVQEIDRLIAAMPSRTTPKADLTGAMGTGAEGFQVGQVTPEAAVTPKVLPGVPSQAEVMAKTPGEAEAVISAGGEPKPESLLRRFLGQVGLIDVEKARERERQREAAQAVVQMEGGPERQQDLGPLGQALSGAAEAVTLGVPSAVAQAAGMPTGRLPETTAEQIGRGAGELAGFMVTPLAVGKATASKTLGWLEPLATDSVGKVFVKEVARQAGVLSAASTAMETGQALSASDAAEMAKLVATAAGKGALLGATFGAVTQAIPDKTLMQTAARIGAGLALVDAQQGKTPWDDRAVAQKTFDYGLNVFFLFRGQNPREVLGRLQAEAAKAGVDVDTFVRSGGTTTAPEPAEKVQEGVPPPQGVPPQVTSEVADVLRRAEEASQRAEAALKQVEALTAKAKAPPSLEVPPEAKSAAPEAKPVVPTAEVPPPPTEKPNLPPGRMAEPAPPEAPPAEVLPSAETKPLGKTEPSPPEDEMAALRRELNPEEPAFRKTNQPEIPTFTPLQEAIRRAWGEPGGTTAIEAARQGTLPLFLDAYQALPASLRGMWEQAGGFTPDAIWRTLRGDFSRLTPIQRTFLRRLGAEIVVPGEPERPAFREAPREAAPPFFSQLQREIDQRLPARATPEQVRNIVASGAVKADEVKWSGLEDYLAQLPPGQMVDKAALQRFLREKEQSGIQAFSEITKPQSLGEQLFQYLGGELAAVTPLKIMDAAMLPSLKHDQIRQAVIKAIPVDVVNMVTQNGFTPEDLLRKPDMVSHALPVDRRPTVARGLSGALEFVGTQLRTALQRILSPQSAGRDGEVLPAVRASDLDASEVVRFLAPNRIYGGERSLTDSRFGSALPGAKAPSTIPAQGELARIGREFTTAELADSLNRHSQIIAQSRPGEVVKVYAPTPEMRRSVVQEGQPMFMARQQPGESEATWGQRWLRIFKPSLAHRIEVGSGLMLTDTWMERSADQLRAFAAEAQYLIPISREAKGLFGEIHDAIHRDQPDLGGIDLLGLDTGFGETASLIPALSLEKSRPQMVLNPYAILEEAKGIAAAEKVPVLPVFGRVLRESILHEFAHAVTGLAAHDGVFDNALSDLRERYGTYGEKEINRLASVLRGYHYDRFANDSDEFRISAVERGGTPPGQRHPPGTPSGAIFAQYEPPGSPGLARPISAEGTRPENRVGGGPGAYEAAPRGTVPSGVRTGWSGHPRGATPELGGTPNPARREAGQPPEPARPDLTERVAQAGKQFPQEDFARWAESMRGALGPGVEPYLKPAWDTIKGVEARTQGEIPPPVPPPESPASTPPKPPEATPQPPEGPPPLEEPRLRLEHHKAVVDAAGEMFDRAGIARDQERWPVLSDQILDAMREGTLELPVMREVLQAHGLTLAEFGESMFRPAVRNAAQRLQMLSVLQRRLNRMAVEAGKGTEADALLNLAQQVETLRREGGDEAPLKELSWWRRADNIRRGMLVTQLATAVRNFETQVGRLGIDVLDQATQKVFGGKVADPWASWEAFADTLSQVRPTKGGMAARKASQAEIESLLQAFPKEWDRLFGSYSSDIARQAKEAGTPLGGVDRAFTQAEKVVNLLNFFNRFQEFAVRRSVFEADLGSRLERRGIDLEALAKGERRLSPEEWDVLAPDVKASVQKALEITFAQSAPYGSLGWHFTQFVNKAPVILTGPLPFPRFMVNSLKFLYDFSPMPLLKLMTSAERAKIAAGDRQMLSRASIGTAALLGAWLIREAQPDENKWYEMDVPGLGTTDIRPFNPFAAYFFLGDLAKRARTNTLYRTDWRDIVRGVASANVSGGLGLFALDKIIAGLGDLAKPGKTMEAVSQAGGEVLSGLLVPLRTLTDLYAQFDPEWQVVRERRGEPLLGPAKAQFGMGEPQYVPTRAEPQKREQPVLRQATGITAVTAKNDLEKELDRFQFSRTEIQGPSTGDPVADNLIAKHMGQLAENQTLAKVNSLRYQGLSDPQRMEWLKVELARIRAIARSAAKREDPELFKEVEAGKVPGRRRLLNEERAGQGLAPLRGR